MPDTASMVCWSTEDSRKQKKKDKRCNEVYLRLYLYGGEDRAHIIKFKTKPTKCDIYIDLNQAQFLCKNVWITPSWQEQKGSLLVTTAFKGYLLPEYFSS